MLVGYPRRSERGLENVAGLLKGGELVAEYAKMELPNYQVFDEKRYFVAGEQPCVLEIEGFRVALSVCEDIWHERPTALAVAAGAELVLNINASPFHLGKHLERRKIVARRAIAGGVGVIYVNQVGGQDELVFDGGSLAMDATARSAALAPHFEEGLYPVRSRAMRRRQSRCCRRAVAAEPNLRRHGLRGAGHRRARLREQEPLHGRGAGPVRRHRFGADAGHRGGCARAGRASRR